MSRSATVARPRVPKNVRAAAERVLEACPAVIRDSRKGIAYLCAKGNLPVPHIAELDEAQGALFDLARALEWR